MTTIKAAAEPSRENLLALADQQSLARRRFHESDAGLIRESEIIEWALRHAAAPAGNAGVRDEQVEIACAAYAKATDYYVEFHRGLSSVSSDEMRKGMRAALAALAIPQPREAFADEIKRADAAPPEASFDNTSDMLGYLNAPAREAEPYDVAFHENMLDQIAASPSPIPEAPVDWPPPFEPMKLQASKAGCGDWIDIYPAQLDQMLKQGCDIRAIKPQDGGESGL